MAHRRTPLSHKSGEQLYSGGSSVSTSLRSPASSVLPQNRCDAWEDMYRESCPTGQLLLNPCLFVWTRTRRLGRCCGRVARSWCRSGGAGHRPPVTKAARKRRDAIRVASATSAVMACFLLFLSHHRSAPSPHALPLLIESLRFSDADDLGGFLYPRYSSFVSWNRARFNTTDSFQPDWNGLQFRALLPGDFARRIAPNDTAVLDLYLAAFYSRVFDDDGNVITLRRNKPRHSGHVSHSLLDDDELSADTCRRTSWHRLYTPNCNFFHEFDLHRDFAPHPPELHDYQTSYGRHGYYRDVWLLHNHAAPDSPDDAMALKMLRYKHKRTLSNFETVRKDALVMERLTSSPRIVDIYGHCASTVGVELIQHEVEENIVPGTGYAKQADLHDEQRLRPKNPYTPTQKLDMALAMAESIADLHGFKDGVIVHDDVQLCQWLKTRDGKFKLGDFNRAEVMLWTEEQGGAYCKYVNGQGYGNYRAPEEFAAGSLDEKIDIFSLGNNIYALLTGLWVFYENEDDEVVQTKLIDKQLPFVDERYRTQSFAEGKLVEIMERCWIYDPEERIDIFQLVRLLRAAFEENKLQLGIAP